MCQGVNCGRLYQYHLPEPPVKVMVSILTQPEKQGSTSRPIQSRLIGRVSSFNPVQSAKADVPRDVTESGITAELREVQPLNAPFPMNSTESGNTTDTRDVQPLNV